MPKCPACGSENIYNGGKFVNVPTTITQDVAIRIWFIQKTYTVTLQLNISYCAGCGFLKVEVPFWKIQEKKK